MVSQRLRRRRPIIQSNAATAIAPGALTQLHPTGTDCGSTGRSNFTSGVIRPPSGASRWPVSDGGSPPGPRHTYAKTGTVTVWSKGTGATASVSPWSHVAEPASGPASARPSAVITSVVAGKAAPMLITSAEISARAPKCTGEPASCVSSSSTAVPAGRHRLLRHRLDAQSPSCEHESPSPPSTTTPSETAVFEPPALLNARTLTKYLVPAVRDSPFAVTLVAVPTEVKPRISVPPAVVPTAY